MHVLVDAANDEDLVVVPYGLRSEELLRLLQTTLHALNLPTLRVQCEAVADPAIVTSEYKNLRIIEREATHGVTCRPVILSVDVDYGLPFLLLQVTVAIEPLNAIQWLLILRIAPSNDVQVAAIKHTDGVVVA